MADQELTQLQIMTTLASNDLFFARDLTDNIDKQITAANVFNFLSTRSIDDLGDVDTTTVAPISGDQLEWNGTNWVPGHDSSDFTLRRTLAVLLTRSTVTSSTSTLFQQLTFPCPQFHHGLQRRLS